jgi:hypothetical protein
MVNSGSGTSTGKTGEQTWELFEALIHNEPALAHNTPNLALHTFNL